VSTRRRVDYRTRERGLGPLEGLGTHMASTNTANASPTPGTPHLLQAHPRLHFVTLTQVEKTTFEAGLRTRLWNRLFTAVNAPTAGEYARLKGEHIAIYQHLLELLRAEAGHAGEPVTDEHIRKALERVEDDLGESWRHKLEHAINVSQSALKVMARAEEAPLPPGSDANQAAAWLLRWHGGWLLLNWSIDCVLAATDPGVVTAPEVVQALFRDLRAAADSVYVTACEVYDARLGDPDDE
jgi:hypothetical protein